MGLSIKQNLKIKNKNLHRKVSIWHIQAINKTKMNHKKGSVSLVIKQMQND